MNEVVHQTQQSQPETPPSESRSQTALAPAVDIVEQADSLMLIADMPGVTRESLYLEVDNNVLSLEGDIQLSMPEGLTALHAEVNGQRFARRFTLSHEIDSEAISACIDNGVLTVTLPKKDSHRVRRIEVQAA
ncbi:Molecular chaperone IbpA, HSP20 family [Franzmannia pantelleriensis]|uniref:Molecular chaperone IbpA, HSP20 family n=1 Tax=Franzmannia pantelleriensis TaxID=48727 RepID=A0A1G9WAL2_9GAMM|nr:Hsp20/alpha crystallin family protein [Halomonas pantelleriensis]SDM81035.1 Molecular chaperone IbpA, HSP20 family [Halomonas pantelleriensis]